MKKNNLFNNLKNVGQSLGSQVAESTKRIAAEANLRSKRNKLQSDIEDTIYQLGKHCYETEGNADELILTEYLTYIKEKEQEISKINKIIESLKLSNEDADEINEIVYGSSIYDEEDFIDECSEFDVEGDFIDPEQTEDQKKSDQNTDDPVFDKMMNELEEDETL